MRPTPQTPRTRLLGAAMIVAPLLLLASTVAYTLGGGLGEDQVGGVLQVYAMAAFMLAVIGLTRMLEHHAPRAAAALTLIGAIGVAGGVAYGINSIYADIGTLDLNENVEGAAGPLALQMPGILFPLTFVALGVALARTHAQPRRYFIALAAAGVLFPLSRIPSVETLALLADTLFVAALLPLGWAMLRDDPRAATYPHESNRSPAAVS